MPEITMEQVEKLRQKADVSVEEAKAALEQTGGDLLDAVILLERQGKTRSTSGGYYTTRGGSAPTGPQVPPTDRPGQKKSGAHQGKQAEERVREVVEAAVNVLRHCTVNQLEIWRQGALMTSIPIVVVILLVIFAVWITIPLLVVGLFFGGCRLRFAGPDLGTDQVNRAMDRMCDSVDEMRAHMKKSFHDHENKKK